MHGCVPRQTLKSLRHVDEIADALFLLVFFPEFRIHFQSFVERDVEFPRNHLRDRIGLGVREIQNTGNVTDDAARGHRAERDDLDDTVTTVLSDDIINDFLASLEAEVHVDIRHGHTFRVEKTLEDQTVFERIKICNAERVGDDRTCGRTSSGTDDNAVIFGKFYIVPHNQEIVDKSHIPYRTELIFEATFYLRGNRVVAFRETLAAQFVKVRPGVISFRHLIFRQFALAERNRYITSLSDFFRVGDCFRYEAKERRHLLGRFDVVLPTFIAETILVGNLLARLQAQKDVMGIDVFLVRIVAVVGADERIALLIMETDQLPVDMFLLRNSVVLKLEEEVILTEDIPVFTGNAFRAFIIPTADSLGNLTGQAG